MAKKTVDDDVSFDDMDFDQSLDIGDLGGYTTESKSGPRAVVESTKQSFLTGVKEGITDSGFIRRLVGLTMPKGYSQLFNAYDGTRDAVKKIYSDNEGELRPHMVKANRLLTQRKSRFKSLLPKSLREAMESADYQDQQSKSSSNTGPDELGQNLSSLDKLFSLETSSKVEQRIEDQRKEVKSDQQFNISIASQTDVAASIGRLVTYQDKILINYHRRSLEIGYRQFDVQRRLFISSDAFFKDALVRLDAIQKNSAMPDYVKMTHKEAVKERIRNKLADATIGGLSKFRANYFKKVTEAASGVLGGALSMGGMMTGMGDGMSKSEMTGSIIGQQLSSMVVPKLQQGAEHLADLASPLVNKIPGVKDTGNTLRMFFADPVGFLNRFRQSDDEGTGVLGTAMAVIKNLLPSYTPADKVHGLGIDSLGDTAQFDNLFYTSVTQVLPAYLESMDKSLRSLAAGEDQESQAWSHYTGGMVSRSTLDDQHLRIGVFRGQGQNIRKEVASLVGKMGGDDLSPEAADTLSRRMLVDLQKGQGFEPKDYVKPDSWTEASADVADELIEFFAERFELDNEGKYIGKDLSFVADIKEAFKDSSDRIPKSLERAQVLSERVMGRDVFRRLGLSEYDGQEGDQIVSKAWTDMALGGDQIAAIKPTEIPKPEPEPASGSKTLKQKISGIGEGIQTAAKEVRRKLDEAEEQQRIEAEAARLAGKNDNIDTVQRPINVHTSPKPVRPIVTPVSPPTPVPPTVTPVGSPNVVNNVTMSDLKDTGTHERLDAILKKMTEMGDFSNSSSGPSLGEVVSDWANTGADKVSKGYNATVKKAKEVKASLQEKADHWYKTSPKVRKVVDKIERTYGEVTDPANRAKLIEAVYTRTGTPEEIYAYFSSRFEEVKKIVSERTKQGVDFTVEQATKAKAYGDEKYGEAKDWVLDIYEDRERYKKLASDKVDQGKDWTKAKYQQGKDTAKDLYERREELTEQAKDKLGEFGTGVKDSLKGMQSAITDWLERKMDFSGLADTGTHERLDINNELLQLLVDGGYGSGGGSDGDSPKPKKGLLRRGLGAVGSAFGAVGSLAWKGVKKTVIGVPKTSWWLTKNTVGLAGSAIGGAYNLALGNKTWGVRDVHVVGEDKPRLRAKDISEGKYFDKNSKKVIKGLSDITGPVIEIQTGNEIISQEEFDKKLLVDGKGESLTMYLGRKLAAVAKFGVLSTLGIYALMGKAMWSVGKMAFNVIKDQFTQFDAYFPGEDKPRIKSTLLKQGYYRDKKGGVIMSLKEITGPVYDIDGNEIISQEDIDKYKSLYARNGSLLFTFGRGMASIAGWAGKAAWGAAKLMMAPGIAMIKGVGKGIKAVGRGIKNIGKWGIGKVTGLFKGKKVSTGEATTGDGGGYSDGILLEQLRIQVDILESIRAVQKNTTPEKGLGVHDQDGDGIKDNSWRDIMRKRKERAAAKAAAKTAGVAGVAANMGGGNTGKTEDEESGGGSIWDTVKTIGATVGGVLGLDKLFGSKKPPKPGKPKAGLVRRALGFAKRAAWGTTKFAVRNAWGLARFAVMRLIVPAIVTTVSAAVSLVGLPVLLVGLAIGAIGYIGYRMYKNAQFKDKPLYHLRMTQYGVNPSKEAEVEKILQLETMMSAAITGVDTVSPNFNSEKVDMRKIYQLFGLLPMPEPKKEGETTEAAPPQEDPEMDETRRDNLVRWLAYRFKPAYLKHCAAMHEAVKTYDLNKVDTMIRTKSVMTTFLDTVVTPRSKPIYDNVTEITPWDYEMTQDNDDVHDMVVRCRDLSKELPDKIENPDVPDGYTGPTKSTDEEAQRRRKPPLPSNKVTAVLPVIKHANDDGVKITPPPNLVETDNGVPATSTVSDATAATMTGMMYYRRPPTVPVAPAVDKPVTQTGPENPPVTPREATSSNTVMSQDAYLQSPEGQAAIAKAKAERLAMTDEERELYDKKRKDVKAAKLELYKKETSAQRRMRRNNEDLLRSQGKLPIIVEISSPDGDYALELPPRVSSEPKARRMGFTPGVNTKTTVDPKTGAKVTTGSEVTNEEHQAEVSSLTDKYGGEVTTPTPSVKPVVSSSPRRESHPATRSDVELQSPADVSRGIAKRAEAAQLQNISMSSSDTNTYLSHAVNKLTSIDSTLKSIEGVVSQRLAKPETKPGAPKPAPPPPVRPNADLERLNAQYTAKMSGGTRDAKFDVPPPRTTISNRRSNAVT